MKPAENRKEAVRPFSGEELIVATHNNGKLKELREMFGDKVKKLSSSADHDLPSPEETGTTFLENARLKAQFVAEATGKPALADDSGICVVALDDAPGVYSADWAEEPGKPRDFGLAMKKVNDLLGDNPDRRAYYVCCLVLAWPDGHCESFEGYAHGTLVWPPRGDQGFGYDPIFVPEGGTRTYAEVAMDKKTTSARNAAFRMMMEKCFR